MVKPIVSNLSILELKISAISDKNRRIMVERISQGPVTVKEIHMAFSMTLPAILRHLSIIEKSGIAVSIKSGRTRTFFISSNCFDELVEWLDIYNTTAYKTDHINTYAHADPILIEQN
jgi:DNA-binding transcriptional ArsR family regulator